jgi:hypothetical protein
MTKSQVTFIGLCVCAPASFLLFYPTYRQNESAAVVFMICGVIFGLVLFGWSLWSFRRQPIKSVFGLVICGYCFWHVLIIPGYVEAVKRHLTARRPSGSLQARVDGRFSSASRATGLGLD